MTLDQKIQVWMVIGTWLAGLGTFAAVIVALYLSRRVEKVRLKVCAGLREVILGDGSPFQRHLGIGVTNLGERPVTVNSVGWAVGRRRQRRFALQPESGPYTNHYSNRARPRKKRQLYGLVSCDTELAEGVRHWVRQRPIGSIP